MTEKTYWRTAYAAAALHSQKCCNIAVDAGTGQGFEKGIIRGGDYFRAVTPTTDPVAYGRRLEEFVLSLIMRAYMASLMVVC